MSPRRISLILIAVLLGFAAWWFWPRAQDSSGGTRVGADAPAGSSARDGSAVPGSSIARSGGAAVGSRSGVALPPVTPEMLAADFPVVAPLNARNSNIAGDLETLRNVLDGWRSNFPREGNPVGENSEITAALTGKNRLSFALIPPNHPAINGQGELCDRWGTPFRFHQISGEHMELRSAGPDRKFGTPDDALLSPGSP